MFENDGTTASVRRGPAFVWRGEYRRAPPTFTARERGVRGRSSDAAAPDRHADGGRATHPHALVLDPTGHPLFARHDGAAGVNETRDVAVEASGAAFVVVGVAVAGIDLGAGPLDFGAVRRGAFVVKLAR